MAATHRQLGSISELSVIIKIVNMIRHTGGARLDMAARFYREGCD